MFRNDDRGTGRFRMMVQFCVRIFIVDYDMEIGYGIGALRETLWCQYHTQPQFPTTNSERCSSCEGKKSGACRGSW